MNVQVKTKLMNKSRLDSWWRIVKNFAAYATWENVGESGRDIKQWVYFGDQQPSEAEYDHFCRHCWSKGEKIKKQSEREPRTEDYGSSSSDA